MPSIDCKCPDFAAWLRRRMTIDVMLRQKHCRHPCNLDVCLIGPVNRPIGSYISCNWCGNGDRQDGVRLRRSAVRSSSLGSGKTCENVVVVCPLARPVARRLLTRPKWAIRERSGHASAAVNQRRLIDGHAGLPAAPAAKKDAIRGRDHICPVLSLSAVSTVGVEPASPLALCQSAIDDAGAKCQTQGQFGILNFNQLLASAAWKICDPSAALSPCMIRDDSLH
jgi:hypothetical protein